MNNPNFTSTKFILAVALCVISGAMVMVGRSDDKSWYEFVTWVFGLFIGGNVADKFTPLLRGK